MKLAEQHAFADESELFSREDAAFLRALGIHADQQPSRWVSCFDLWRGQLIRRDAQVAYIMSGIIA